MSASAMLSPTAAYHYVSLGHGTFTLVGRATRYTYRLNRKEDSPIFVSLLTGPDNTADFEYLGFIPPFDNRTPMKLLPGRKGNPTHPAFRALAWWLSAWAKDSELAGQAEFWHEGTCGHCGRKLTTPESIQRGIGPVCESRMM